MPLEVPGGLRLRVILLVVATSSLVLVSFLVPLALVLRSFAANQAVSKATTQAQSLAPLVGTDFLTPAVVRENAGDGGSQVTVFLPSGQEVGLLSTGTATATRATKSVHSFTPISPR